MNKAITINEVAVRAGVSVSTVSKALSGKGRMSDETRVRIIETAKQMGYMPNRAAQALSRKTVTIAALLPNSPKQVQSLLLRGLEDAFTDYTAFNIKYRIIDYTEEPDQRAIRECIASLAGQVDALIFQGDDSLADAVSKYHGTIPVVTLVTGGERFHAVTSVLIDAECVGRLAAQFLAICGAKHTVVMAGREGTTIHAKNIAGYNESAAKYGMRVEKIYYTEDIWERAYRYTAEAVERCEDLDGIFVSSYLAPSVCNCLKDKGLGGKVKVVGVDLYDEIEACLKDGSLLATVYQNQYLQARDAVDTVMNCISTGVEELPPSRIKPELVMVSNLGNYSY